MESEFCEFSLSFAVTRELIIQNSGSLFAAPEFPSLLREGRVSGGHDVKLDFGSFLFLQFKLTECMCGGRAGQGATAAGAIIASGQPTNDSNDFADDLGIDPVAEPQQFGKPRDSGTKNQRAVLQAAKTKQVAAVALLQDKEGLRPFRTG